MKTKALISFAVSAKLICVFVFANADCWFSHGAAQISNIQNIINDINKPVREKNNNLGSDQV